MEIERCGRQIPNPQHSERPNEKGKGRRKKLLEEAKNRQANDAGNCKYRVKGPPWARKIVKIRPAHDEDVA